MAGGQADFAAKEQSRNAITGQFLVKGCHHIARQFALGYSYIPVTYAIQIFGMATEMQTVRVRRTWLDKLQFWQRAYQTKIFDERREVFGRGPTREASVEEAERRWVAESAEKAQQGSPPTGRILAGLDQSELARLAKVHITTIVRLEAFDAQ